MNIKDYKFLYDLLQELITEQVATRGGQVIGRWPIYELFNRSNLDAEGKQCSIYPISQICHFFNIVLQYNEDLLKGIVTDMPLKLKELKHELDSIDIITGDVSLNTVLPEPPKEVVDEMLSTLFKEPPTKFNGTCDTPRPPPPIIKEDEIEEEIPEKEEQEQEEKKEVITTMLNEQLRQIDAQFDILQDKLFLHPKFKTMVDDLPDKIMKLFDDHGELTVKEVVQFLQIDTSVRGVRIAFVVAWQQCENQLIDAETLIG